ncbi:MAG: inositol monophosphatase, partial [Boseongicola sp. SB0662_bin_57]|nr:inositol monophosphatase [Boseongicola sp. SB0662_bin_57]
RLRVSNRHRMIDSVFGTGLPFAGRAHLPVMLRELSKLLPKTAGVRQFGAAALGLAYVAAGRYEGFWERDLRPWDIAAGILLVREAGGFADGVVANTNPMVTGDVLAANSEIYEAFAKVIRAA